MYIMHIQKTDRNSASLFLLLFTAVAFFCSLRSHAQPPPNLIYAPVVTTGLSSPVDIVNAGDGTNRLFIVERTGKVRIINGGVLLAAAFLDISDSFPPGDENGFLSMAFHPEYETNGYLFIYYLNADYDIRITRFQSAAPTTNTPINQTTGVVIMTIPAVTASFHNGGKLNFGPDGHLYFAPGDGSPGGDPDNHAQDGNLLWGKMIRINVDNFTTPPYYTIPANNPYVNDPAVRDEIFAIGLRNPWRWSFDRLNHDVWVADVGESAWEEVNYRSLASSGGINYGWRCYEGNEDYVTAGCLPQSNYVFPVFTYPHNSATGGYSVIGGHVYRGTEYAAMYGYYICVDFVTGNAWLIKPNGSGGWNISQQSGLATGIVGFGEDENGVLYAVKLSGTLFKITTNSGGPLPVTLLQFNVKAFTGYNEVRWKTVNEQHIAHYEIEYSTDRVSYAIAGRVHAVNNPAENNYHFPHAFTGFTKLYYRLKVTDRDGRLNYSDVVEVDRKDKAPVKIYPTFVTDHQLNIFSEKQVEQVFIYSAEGKRVFANSQNNMTGIIHITLPKLPSGVYLVRIKLKDDHFTGKIYIGR